MTHDPIRDWQNKRREQQAEDEAAARDRHNERLKERARLAYLTAGGDEKSFNEEWPAIRRELLRDETIRTVRGDNK
jgi:hypothetical protein